METEAQRAHYRDAQGVRIHYTVHAVDDPRAVVQLVHGVGEHSGRYGALIAELNAAGYTVWADDHRGHGLTGFEQHGGDLDRMGRLGPGGLRAAIEAVWQFTGIVRDANPGRPLVLLGHSWGSFIAQILLNRHPSAYDAVVLTGTALRWPGYMEARPLNRRHARPGGTGAEWLSRDPAAQEAFVRDPYCTLVPLQRLFGVRDAARLYGRPAQGLPDIPLLIMVGDDDSVGGERSALALADAYVHRSRLSDVELIVYPGARHEIFNETNQDEVRADLLHWLDERLPPAAEPRD